MTEKAMTSRLHTLHEGQSGAIALLCMAAILIIAMMGLLIFDSIEIANEKVHIQASADASAYSQATVNARTMNMSAFSNVGKRVNIGYVAAYDTIMGWMQWLVVTGTILTVACWVGSFFAPPLAKLCQKLTRILAGAACVYGLEEGVDRVGEFSDVVTDTYGPEIRGFNNYQQFMADITPYWAWSEGVFRGFMNKAPITVGYPAPKDEDEVTYTSQMPMSQPSNHSWDDLCEKANDTPSIGDSFRGGGLDEVTGQADRWYMFVDYAFKNIGSAVGADLDSFENAGSDAGTGDSGGPGDEGSPEMEDQCGNIEEQYEEGKIDEYNNPDDCDDPEEDDCDDEDHYMVVDGEEIELDDNCIDVDLSDALDEIDCGDVSQIGKYMAVGFAGLMGLIFDTSELPSIIQTALPTAFVDRCGSSSSGTHTQSGDRFGGGDGFVEDGAPWELDTDDWAMQASNLMFAYRPNAARNQESRDKFDFVSGHMVGDPALATSGVWAMSRGEITWQGDDEPTLWESEWGARLRPVALPDEWEGYEDEFTIWQALQEVEDEMFGALFLAHAADMATDDLITNPYGPNDLSGSGLMGIAQEYYGTEKSFEPMENSDLEGLPK